MTMVQKTYIDVALVKMFYTRRNTDQAFKKQISDTASIISKIAIDHFTKTHFSKCT